MPIYSDAARAFARENFPPDSPSSYSAAFGYDAGHAAALATVTPAPTPRTITTAAELDALPGGSAVRGGDGWVYQCNHDSTAWYLGLRSEPMTSEQVAQDAPLTLLVPATAAPESERLTDPDDPRIKPGARLRGEWDDGSAVEGAVYATGGPIWVKDGCLCWSFKEFAKVYLLAEAAEDPDAEKHAILAKISQDGVDRLATLTANGWDLVRRAE